MIPQDVGKGNLMKAPHRYTLIWRHGQKVINAGFNMATTSSLTSLLSPKPSHPLSTNLVCPMAGKHENWVNHSEQLSSQREKHLSPGCHQIASARFWKSGSRGEKTRVPLITISIRFVCPPPAKSSNAIFSIQNAANTCLSIRLRANQFNGLNWMHGEVNSTN